MSAYLSRTFPATVRVTDHDGTRELRGLAFDFGGWVDVYDENLRLVRLSRQDGIEVTVTAAPGCKCGPLRNFVPAGIESIGT